MNKSSVMDIQRRLAKFKKANAEFVKEIIYAAEAGKSNNAIRYLIDENAVIFSAIFGIARSLSLNLDQQHIGESIVSHVSIEVVNDDLIKRSVSEKDVITKPLEHEHVEYFGDGVG
jgi:hypothetical protein